MLSRRVRFTNRFTAPRVPQELIVCNEETRLDPSIPHDGNEDLYRDFDNWVDSGASGHEGMSQASVYVSNWTEYRLFQEALKAAMWRPICRRSKGGRCRPGSPRALAELQRFTSQTRLAPTPTWWTRRPGNG